MFLKWLLILFVIVLHLILELFKSSPLNVQSINNRLLFWTNFGKKK